MDDRQKEPVDPVIVDWFTNTLLPIFSWFLSRLFSGIVDCKVTVVLLHPSTLFKNRVACTWVENNQLFSCAEVLSFQTASGRRRSRRNLRKLFGPFLREIKRSREWLLFRHHLQEKWNKLREAVCDETPPEIPPNSRIEIDIAEQEKKRGEQLSPYSQDDILSVFPIGSTLADDNLRKRVAFEVDGYPETMHGILWEASQDWNLLRQVSIRKDSEIWEILNFDPNDEPDLEALMDWALDVGLGEANEDKLMYLSRWFIDRILVSQFILHPYSDKRFVSLQKRVADDLTLEDVVADDTQETFYRDEAGGLSNLCNHQTELSEEQRKQLILDLFAKKGIEYGDLTPKEWSEIFERHDLLRQDYEFSSKTGMSITSYYGPKAHAKEQRWSRIKKKIYGLSNNPKGRVPRALPEGIY